eukprot:767757-Hanusia_phi.AAC.1
MTLVSKTIPTPPSSSLLSPWLLLLSLIKVTEKDRGSSSSSSNLAKSRFTSLSCSSAALFSILLS